MIATLGRFVNPGRGHGCPKKYVSSNDEDVKLRNNVCSHMGQCLSRKTA